MACSEWRVQLTARAQPQSGERKNDDRRQQIEHVLRLSSFCARQSVAELALPVALAILSTKFGLLRGPNTISDAELHSESDSKSDSKQNPSRMGTAGSDSE